MGDFKVIGYGVGILVVVGAWLVLPLMATTVNGLHSEPCGKYGGVRADSPVEAPGSFWPPGDRYTCAIDGQQVSVVEPWGEVWHGHLWTAAWSLPFLGFSILLWKAFRAPTPEAELEVRTTLNRESQS